MFASFDATPDAGLSLVVAPAIRSCTATSRAAKPRAGRGRSGRWLAVRRDAFDEARTASAANACRYAPHVGRGATDRVADTNLRRSNRAVQRV